jgi:prepilin-type N-terminal cleavage/methylation domain-containing protein
MNLKNKGFTLAEIMVSIAIVVMIMSVVLFGYRSYNDNIILSSAGQEMAISIRQAQVYGVSVKQVVGGDFNTSYGISFDLSNPGSYYIFADKNNNGKYDGDVNCSSGTECVEKDDLKNAVGLSSFCSTDLGGVETCPDTTGIRSVSILFKRPDTEAYIYTFNSSGTMISGSYRSIKIIFSTRSGQQSSVSVNSVGQVTVK